MNIIINNILFGILISLIAFEFGKIVHDKTKVAVFNPLLIAITSIIIILKVFNIDTITYNKGAEFINAFLGPATVVLAVPLYKNINLFKRNYISILVGVFIGCIVAISSVIILCLILKLEDKVMLSLVSKSITTPIGIEVTKSLNGVIPITVLAIIVSGITGAIIGPWICRLFKIKDSVAIGVAIGTASHAVGTTKALELGEVEGTMSSLSIGIAGIITAFIAPFIVNMV